MISELQQLFKADLNDHIKVCNALNLKLKEYPDDLRLFCVKYDQLETKFDTQAAREARGIIFDYDYNVVARAFDKFFNYGEGYAASIDWSTAKVQEKLDGSMVMLYQHKSGVWMWSTTGTAMAEGQVGDTPFTFSDLCWKMYNEVRPDNWMPESGYVYIFELMTPFNKVVVPIDKNRLVILGMRRTDTWDEIDPKEYSGWNDFPKEYPLTSMQEVVNAANTLPWCVEGYVVRDNHFNRVKVKSPQYVAVHHMKGSITVASIVAAIWNGELSELLVYFPEVSEIEKLYDIVSMIDLFKGNVEIIYNQIISKTYPARKELAADVFYWIAEYNMPKWVSGLIFSRIDGKHCEVSTDKVADWIKMAKNV